MNYFNFNGKVFEEGSAVVNPNNRGLRYGDGLFETMKYRNNELILADEHFARLWKGLQVMKFEIPKLFTPEFIQAQVIQLVKKNKQTAARVRLSVVRGDGGLYDTKNHFPVFIIQSWALADEITTLNENGLQLCIYDEAIKTIDSFSNTKHNNYLPYFMGALFAKEQQCNDAVILNHYSRICDTTIANIFLIKNEVIYTPSLNEGCIAGIMRKFIIQNLVGYPVVETEITKELLLGADEVFLSNSIYNIRWVVSIEQKNYSNTITQKIFESLHKTNETIFC